jgi:hypothetical protein
MKRMIWNIALVAAMVIATLGWVYLLVWIALQAVSDAP